MDQWSVFSGIEVQRKNWPNSKNAVLTVKEEDRKSCHEDLTAMSSTIFGNTIRKQITGPIWEAKRHKKNTIDRSGNTEKWTAVKGF